MLAKDSDICEEFSARITDFKHVDTNVYLSDLGKKGNEDDINFNFDFGTKRSNLISVEESFHLNKARDNWIVPEGYQLLPKEYFQFEGVPPPLILSSWLKLLNSDEESAEDSIPLAKLQKKIKRKKRSKKVVESDLTLDLNNLNKCKQNSKGEKKDKEYSPINRKRGRPKKQPAEKLESVDNEKDELFWNDEGDFSHPEIQNEMNVEVNFEKQNYNAEINNYNEHDYFRPVENCVLEDSAVNNEKEKRKRKSAIQGVKIGDSKISFPCLECGKSFSAASTLKCHQRIHNGTLLICPECHKGFINKYLLKCHMRIHNGDLFMCHKCGRGFITAELLKVHSRAHTGDRPFICNICGKSFPTSSNMLQHKQIHNSEKKFLCSQCGSSFIQKRCLDYHMLTHAEKKNICNVCGKLWARKSDLIEHMRVHTGVKPYCCRICPQKFSQASSLKRHQLVHMDVKPISCAACNKMFKCQDYYKRHLRKHEKEDFLCSSI